MEDIFIVAGSIVILILNGIYYKIIFQLKYIRKSRGYNDIPDFSLIWHPPAFSWAFKKEAHDDTEVESLRLELKKWIKYSGACLALFFVLSLYLF